MPGNTDFAQFHAPFRSTSKQRVHSSSLNDVGGDDHAFDGIGLGHVRFEKHGLIGIEAGQGVARLRVVLEHVEDDLRAMRGEEPRGGRADALGGAGDDGDLAREPGKRCGTGIGTAGHAFTP